MGNDCLRIIEISRDYHGGTLGIDPKSLPQETQKIAEQFVGTSAEENAYMTTVHHTSFISPDSLSNLAFLENSFCKLFQDKAIKKPSASCPRVFTSLAESPEVKFVSVTDQLFHVIFEKTGQELPNATDTLFAQAQQLLEKIKNCETYDVAKGKLEVLRTERAKRLSKLPTAKNN